MAIAGVIVVKTISEKRTQPSSAKLSPPLTGVNSQPNGLPRLLDLGADKCMACKMMTPVLDTLKTEYAGKLEVEFIDVWKNPDVGEKYGLQMIPTQIFFDSKGKELFRHTGFFSKDDILKKWHELGINL